MHPDISEWVSGWDPAPGIVSVWADDGGRALVWRREGGAVLREQARFRPWLLAASPDDLPPAALAAPPDAPISCRELGGPPDSYRFLISARDGRALERALLHGASRRLGRPVASLYDLDGYLRLGPVEQYLVGSGRVYFRGLRYADLHRLQFDLETTDLDPGRGRIFLVALRDSGGLETTLEAPRPEDEPALIRGLCALVAERDPDVIENHNLFGFDLPFLLARAAHHGLPLPLGRPGAPPQPRPLREGPRSRRLRYSVPGRELIDTMDAVLRHDFVARDMPSHGLKDVARYFGVARPERVYLDGAATYATYLARPDELRAYALDDVAEVDALSQRLNAPPFALAGMAPRRYERVAWAGPAMGILEPMLIRAYLRAGQAPPLHPRSRAAEGGAHTGGALHLLSTGLARRVVKADIASLYPSLMRAYRIGPAPDRLGALLGIVEYVLSARLEHKAAARAAPPGSLEAGHHHALQAAMKLIINAAYGYMGATSMALFADMAAADEVTRRGREVLGQVMRGLESQGVALIEADTDGVYFAAPAGWGEAEERAAVARVAATLPAGISLEFEGRYAAMLSHEVKNYALLDYDGRLTLRGVAFRSSRSEPFGERFLRGALRLLMADDVAGLRELFLAAVADLRSGGVALPELAARARLRKSPEQYRAARGREGPYEAVLASGQASWEPGQRVRFYRAAGGGYALLQRDDQAGPPYDPEHYVRVLVESYADRLRKAFRPQDFAQIFRPEAQLGLFDADISAIRPLWIGPGG